MFFKFILFCCQQKITSKSDKISCILFNALDKEIREASTLSDKKMSEFEVEMR